MRPYTTYKAFGGVLTALAMPAAISIILQCSPDGHPIPPANAIFPALLSVVGLYIFVASDRKLKEFKAAHPPDPNERPPRSRPDWTAMAITAGLLLLYLAIVISRNNHWL